MRRLIIAGVVFTAGFLLLGPFVEQEVSQLPAHLLLSLCVISLVAAFACAVVLLLDL